MTRFKRRMLYGTAVVVLVFLWVGAVVYRPTRLALQRAESFQFRRMKVTQLAEQGVHRFFYVTNRRPAPDDQSLEGRFSNEREEKLKFGLFDTNARRTRLLELRRLNAWIEFKRLVPERPEGPYGALR